MADTCCKAFLDPTAAVEAAIYLFLPLPSHAKTNDQASGMTRGYGQLSGMFDHTQAMVQGPEASPSKNLSGPWGLLFEGSGLGPFDSYLAMVIHLA